MLERYNSIVVLVHKNHKKEKTMNRREFLKKGLFSSIIALPLVVFSKQQFAFNDNKKTITKKEFEEIKNNNVNKKTG